MILPPDFGRWSGWEEVAPAWLHAAGSNLAQLLPMLYRFGDNTAEASRVAMEA
ncbi:hypothetical protein ACQP1P_01700 [Dactylosporangium sp. CA-052675]|uniref:hypothetical protein n=1 Tax=Dactylosporangium sp. CA-052675 TaxID=3239927 RepID=UPI003D8DEE8A